MMKLDIEDYLIDEVKRKYDLSMTSTTWMPSSTGRSTWLKMVPVMQQIFVYGKETIPYSVLFSARRTLGIIF